MWEILARVDWRDLILPDGWQGCLARLALPIERRCSSPSWWECERVNAVCEQENQAGQGRSPCATFAVPCLRERSRKSESHLLGATNRVWLMCWLVLGEQQEWKQVGNLPDRLTAKGASERTWSAIIRGKKEWSREFSLALAPGQFFYRQAYLPSPRSPRSLLSSLNNSFWLSRPSRSQTSHSSNALSPHKQNPGPKEKRGTHNEECRMRMRCRSAYVFTSMIRNQRRIASSRPDLFTLAVWVVALIAATFAISGTGKAETGGTGTIPSPFTLALIHPHTHTQAPSHP